MNYAGAEILPIPYLYCGPMVFICAVSLFTIVKNKLNARTLPDWDLSPATRWVFMVSTR